MNPLIACCGLDREACDARIATITNDNALREKTAALWSKLNGVTITPEESTESIKDWSLKTIRKILTEFDATLAWTHIALDEFSLKNYMGDDNVEVTPATALKGTQTRAAIAGEMRPTKAWYFKIKDGKRRALVFVPHGQVTERGEITLLASAAINLPVTLTTYPDAAGKSIYIYLDDGQVAAP